MFTRKKRKKLLSMELCAVFFGVKIWTKIKNRGEKNWAVRQSHWPDEHIFGIKPFSIYFYFFFILIFMFEQSIKN